MRLLIIFSLATFMANAQLKPILLQVKKDTILQWNYHFGDEFYGDKLNANKWHDGYPWGRLLPEQRIYSAPEMVSQNDGLLHLKVDTTSEWKKLPEWLITPDLAKQGIEVKDGSMQVDYITSCIWSKEFFKYGYFECRCKAPSGKGLWPAFWLFGQNQKDEIDIMEMKGERRFETHVDIHLPDKRDKTPGFLGIKKDWGGWVKMRDELTNNWVIFSGVWLPNSLTYYVNGIPVSHFDGDFATSMNLVVNLAAARDNGPFNPGPDKNTVFPNDFLVDYVRVWKPINDPNAKQAEKWQIPINQKPINAENSTSRIKRKVRHVYSKKKLKSESGFISLIPQSEFVYLIQYNGSLDMNLQAELVDQKNISKQISVASNKIDLSGFPKGDYLLKIQSSGLKTQISIKI
jgi:beta-glucanase (GH16 family)